MPVPGGIGYGRCNGYGPHVSIFTASENTNGICGSEPKRIGAVFFKRRRNNVPAECRKVKRATRSVRRVENAVRLQRLGVRRAFHVGGNGFKIRRGPNFDLFVLHKQLSFIGGIRGKYSPANHRVQSAKKLLFGNTMFYPLVMKSLFRVVLSASVFCAAILFCSAS